LVGLTPDLFLPDKAVSEMPEADVLHVVDVHHLAKGSTLDNFLDFQAWEIKKSLLSII
jgi:hypothetical protein